MIWSALPVLPLPLLAQKQKPINTKEGTIQINICTLRLEQQMGFPSTTTTTITTHTTEKKGEKSFVTFLALPSQVPGGLSDGG